MKTNFKKDSNSKYKKYKEYQEPEKEKRGLSKSKFEEHVIKSGARGSFMIYRTSKKKDELGIDEL